MCKFSAFLAFLEVPPTGGVFWGIYSMQRAKVLVGVLCWDF